MNPFVPISRGTVSAPLGLDPAGLPEWLRLGPVLLPLAALVVVLLLDALLPRRRGPHSAVAVVGLVAGAATAFPGALSTARSPMITLCLPAVQTGIETGLTCLWSAGPVASTLQVGILASAVAVLLLLLDQERGDAIDATLVLAAATGGAAVAGARDVASWLIALELATIPLVAMVALRGRRRAAHGAVWLLMTSLVSFALLVLGVALWVTATGDPTFTTASVSAAWRDPAARAVLVVAVLSLLAGLAFKLSAVPFHAWTPVAWTGAPLPVTAALASTSKLAAAAAAIVLLEPFISGVDGSAGPHVVAFALGALALASMLLGNVLALRARDTVRLLAWSTVAQGGWVLLPLAALSEAGVRAAAAYALTYAAAALVALAAVGTLRSDRGERRGEPTAYPLVAFAGLARTRPHIGLPLVLALLTLAGLPPAMLGLFAKLAALRAVIAVGLWPVSVAAVVAVVLGVAVYARWIAVLLSPPDREDERAGTDPSAEPAVDLGRGSLSVLAIGTALLLVASVVPTVLFGLLG